MRNFLQTNRYYAKVLASTALPDLCFLIFLNQTEKKFYPFSVFDITLPLFLLQPLHVITRFYVKILSMLK